MIYSNVRKYAIFLLFLRGMQKIQQEKSKKKEGLIDGFGYVYWWRSSL